MKKRLGFDMDNVLVDFQSGIDRLTPEQRSEYAGRLDECPGIFALMDPYPGAIDAYNTLCSYYDCYIVSTAPWKNPSAWSDKPIWVQSHLHEAAYKRLTLTHHKELVDVDFLIDDRTANGVSAFKGEHIHFETEKFPNWRVVTEYLIEKALRKEGSAFPVAKPTAPFNGNLPPLKPIPPPSRIMTGNWFPVQTEESKLNHLRWEIAEEMRKEENKRRGYDY